MFATLSRSWRFATLSYKVLWHNPRLLVFPVFSTLAAIAVLASFGLPLWASGTLREWSIAQQNHDVTPEQRVMMYAVMFAFYFCNYFVLVFFNSALIAGVMQSLRGEEPTVSGSLALASKRLPQILAWALVSAFVGVALRAIESHQRLGQLVAAVLGSTWTVLTYFVVPSIVMEGLGPVAALKRSAATLKATWGAALVGNFSLGLLGFLLLLPMYLLGIGIIAAGVYAGKVTLLVPAIAVGVAVIAIAAALGSAAHVVFTAVLYSYATGNAVPVGIEADELAQAFGPKQ